MPTTRLISILAEEFRHFFHELHHRLLQKSQAERASALEALDSELSASRSATGQNQYAAYLRLRLRKTPYWTRGHLLLGENALRLNDVATGYACARAVAVLSGPRANLKSEKLLARCYLKRAAFKEACALFEKLVVSAPRDYSLCEDYAAALIGTESFAQARRVLEAIPEDRISAPGKAALLYSRTKTDPELQG